MAGCEEEITKSGYDYNQELRCGGVIALTSKGLYDIDENNIYLDEQNQICVTEESYYLCCVSLNLATFVKCSEELFILQEYICKREFKGL